MTRFLKTPRGALIGLAHIAQIEEQRARVGLVARFFGDTGKELGSVAPPYRLPAGFIEVVGARLFSDRPADVQHVFRNLDIVAQIATSPQGLTMLFAADGRSLGSVRAGDLDAAGLPIFDPREGLIDAA
ncbi:MAG TPA: hypothetical protein VGM07_08520 [Stellaceae bacterium]|jgi:hypothetical protein